jgi:CheY-like chemotaxis protein
MNALLDDLPTFPIHRVLIVDNDADNRESAALLLEMEGYTARTASDGPSALEMVLHFKPEVVMLDIVMPGMDGYELARRLCPLKRTLGFKVVAVSGLHRPLGAEPQLEDVGIDWYVLKPARLMRILHAVSFGQPPAGPEGAGATASRLLGANLAVRDLEGAVADRKFFSPTHRLAAR